MENELFQMHMLELLREILAQLRDPSERCSCGQAHQDSQQMTRQQVITHLGICEATYKRWVKEGLLKPRELPGGHRYYKHELMEARKQSIRKGKV